MLHILGIEDRYPGGKRYAYNETVPVGKAVCFTQTGSVIKYCFIQSDDTIFVIERRDDIADFVFRDTSFLQQVDTDFIDDLNANHYVPHPCNDMTSLVAFVGITCPDEGIEPDIGINETTPISAHILRLG